METPVVFLVYNRPVETRRVFERIRQARPSRLMVVCDGARPHSADDSERVAAVREIIDIGVDWKCDVSRNYASENMGCRNRVASGLNWAFEAVEEAIILEDDCLPDPSFFTFCEQLLQRYREDTRIMHIAGTNFATPHVSVKESYWATFHAPVWGWATWRRAWKHYDFMMETWDARINEISATFANAWERQFWLSDWERLRNNIEDATTWDIMWNFTLRSLGAFSLVPSGNLVENIGIGANGTHTNGELAHLRLRAGNAPRILRHPIRLTPSRFRDDVISRAYAGAEFTVRSNLKAHFRNAVDMVAGCGYEKRPVNKWNPKKCY